MEAIYDFLTFKTFISSTMLYIFYYIGALIVPAIIFKYLHKFYKYLDINLETILSNTQRVKLSILVLGMFLFLEILWRMMFEFLLAYLQIRDALVL